MRAYEPGTTGYLRWAASAAWPVYLLVSACGAALVVAWVLAQPAAPGVVAEVGPGEALAVGDLVTDGAPAAVHVRPAAGATVDVGRACTFDRGDRPGRLRPVPDGAQVEGLQPVGEVGRVSAADRVTCDGPEVAAVVLTRRNAFQDGGPVMLSLFVLMTVGGLAASLTARSVSQRLGRPAQD